VRVFPNLHSCIWTRAAPPGVVVTGDSGLTQDERAAVRNAMPARGTGLPPDVAREARALRERLAVSPSDGGALDYLIETPEGTVFFRDSMGFWTGVLREVRPVVAILAAAGRGNLDGEPVQGAVEHFIAREVEILRPRTVILGDHDNWTGTPDQPDVTDISPVRAELARVARRRGWWRSGTARARGCAERRAAFRRMGSCRSSSTSPRTCAT